MNDDESISIAKEEIRELPVEAFEGIIEVVETLEQAEIAVAELSRCQIIGFDTETRPSFKKGHSHKVALLQLSTEEVCYLFRLNLIGMPSFLLSLLKNEDIKKIGLSLRDDFSMLRKVAPFEPGGFVELQTFVKQFRITDMSLQKIYAILFNRKISKSQRLSNWEAMILTDGQKKYAATDAWACVRIYNRLIKSGSKGIPVGED